MNERVEDAESNGPIDQLLQSGEALKWQLALENAAATRAFNEVLDTAINVCFEDRHTYETALKVITQTDAQAPNAEQQLVEKLGLWGLKANLDFERYGYTFYDDTTDGPGRPVMSDILTHPDLVPVRPDMEIQNKIGAFGTALIEESFKCLGEDAEDLANEFGAADAERQKEIILWLYDRISVIKDFERETVLVEEDQTSGIRLLPAEPIPEGTPRGEPIIINFRDSTIEEVREIVDELMDDLDEDHPDDLDENNQYFYHPVRLSPKIVGTYPNIEIAPTCLGVSVLAASFFAKAGVDYLHAGVMHTALDETRMTQLELVLRIRKIAENHGLTLASEVGDVLQNMEDVITRMRRHDRGHHAIVCVRLANDGWVYFDPNYGSLSALMDIDNERADKVFEALQDFASVDKGNSQMIRSLEGQYTRIYNIMLNDLEERHVEIDDAVDSFMQSDDWIEELKMFMIGRMAEVDGVDYSIDYQTAHTTRDKEKFIDFHTSAVIEKCVLHGMTPEAIKERYLNDESFRHRRIEDFTMAPYLLVLRFLGGHADLQQRNLKTPHATLEAGLPAFRIGACALSDFSLYTGNEIPLSFWVANWAGHVAVESHLPAKNDDSAQAELGRRMSSIIRSSILRQFTSYGIIHKFLEQGENTDGN